MGFMDIYYVIVDYLLYVYESLRKVFSFQSNKYITFDSGREVTICQTIGEGAYSFVYAGTSAGKNCAIKKMYMHSPEFQRCAMMEIESFNRFQHSNILKLLEYSQKTENSSPVMYMLFPLMEQGSLRNVLNRRLNHLSTRPSLRELLTDFTALCEAINVLHSHSPSYVHQDIKPENVLIADDGTPLLTDLGSVRLANIHIGNRTQALRVADESSQFCTISYRAPELFDPQTGTFLDSRTDVWAVGCLLFAWWFGYSPFECEFTDTGGLRVVECTHLRVLSKIPSPTDLSQCTKDDLLILQLTDEILEQDMKKRMFLSSVITRVRQTRGALNGSSSAEGGRAGGNRFEFEV